MVTHLAIGHINIDMYMVIERLPGPDENVVASETYIGPGGAAANYAVAASRLGSTAYLAAHTGRLARELGILSQLERSGVRLDYVRIHEDHPPGLVVVLVTRTGERSMITMRGANEMLRGDEASGSYDAVHVASRGPETLLNACRSVSAAFASYDPGASNTSRRPREVVAAARQCAKLLILNRAEFRHIMGDAEIEEARRLLGDSLSMVLVKRGPEGAALVTRDALYSVEAYRPGRVLDTTGAGDVFAATFNTYYLETGDIARALQAASIAAGLKVSRRGAQSAPSRKEVEERLQTTPPRVTVRRL